MHKELVKLKDTMTIIYCYKANEICMYDKSDWLCYHWDTEKDSIWIIKQYCKDNGINITDIIFKYEDFNLILYKWFYN